MRSLAMALFGTLLLLTTNVWAAGGFVSGTLQFYQAQGNFCPTTRTCTGAQYLQSENGTYRPIGSIKVYLEDSSGAVVGQGSTASNGSYTIYWYRPTMPTTLTLEWRSEHSGGRFYIDNSSGAVHIGWAGFTPIDGTPLQSPQNLGTWSWGDSTTPNQTLNAFDGARRMWDSALSYSSLMTTNFTNVRIVAFGDTGPLGTCTTSCASGSVVQLDASSSWQQPQGRVLHELGHVAREKSRSWAWLSDYSRDGVAGWNLTSSEYEADSFEEGLATFVGDVALYWNNATQPHTCIGTGACTTNSFNSETSTSCSSSTLPRRQAITVTRYLWDVYDTQVDGAVSENIAQPYASIFDTLASYPTGYGNGQHNEPFSAPGVVDDRDGRNMRDFSDRYFAYTSVDEWDAFRQNCD